MYDKMGLHECSTFREAIIAHLNCNTIGGGNRAALVPGHACAW